MGYNKNTILYIEKSPDEGFNLYLIVRYLSGFFSLILLGLFLFLSVSPGDIRIEIVKNCMNTKEVFSRSFYFH